LSGFHDKTVLVTGGSSGIGRATAVALAREGARVIVTGTNSVTGAETVQLVAAVGGSASFLRADLTKDGEIDALFSTIGREFGSLHCAFNNAGIGGGPTPILDAPVAMFDNIFAINSRSVWLCMQGELRLMRSAGCSIVNNSSVFGNLGMGGESAYVASKHAVIGMTRAVALEMASTGIRVNCICPGATKTPMLNRFTESVEGGDEMVRAMIPLRRPAQPEEIAAAALWLMSEASSYVTGQTITLDGGFSIA
jgi:NAD(P)-dependent dehydrogenase (short-subunit alcohol dehydrogenase family)